MSWPHPPERILAAWESPGKHFTHCRHRHRRMSIIWRAEPPLGGGCQLWDREGIFERLIFSPGRRRDGVDELGRLWPLLPRRLGGRCPHHPGPGGPLGTACRRPRPAVLLGGHENVFKVRRNKWTSKLKKAHSSTRLCVCRRGCKSRPRKSHRAAVSTPVPSPPRPGSEAGFPAPGASQP